MVIKVICENKKPPFTVANLRKGECMQLDSGQIVMRISAVEANEEGRLLFLSDGSHAPIGQYLGWEGTPVYSMSATIQEE